MTDWWVDMDGAILDHLSREGGMTPAEVAGVLGMSEHAATSLLARLAQEGKVSIVRVELAATRD